MLKKKSTPKRAAKAAAPARPAARSKAPVKAPVKAAPQSKAKAAPPRAPAVESQLDVFEKAMRVFHRGNFAEAKGLFEKARAGGNLQISHNAGLHIRMCERRLEHFQPQLSTADDHYNYAITLINLRDLTGALGHLETALRMQPRADYVHYAIALCRALGGDAPAAAESLRRAIELEPRNRQAVRRDPDFAPLLGQPALAAVL